MRVEGVDWDAKDGQRIGIRNVVGHTTLGLEELPVAVCEAFVGKQMTFRQKKFMPFSGSGTLIITTGETPVVNVVTDHAIHS